jgi:hypothetical protein
MSSVRNRTAGIKVSADALREADAVNEYRSRLPGRRDRRLHSPALSGPGTDEVLRWHGHETAPQVGTLKAVPPDVVAEITRQVTDAVLDRLAAELPAAVDLLVADALARHRGGAA